MREDTALETTEGIIGDIMTAVIKNMGTTRNPTSVDIDMTDTAKDLTTAGTAAIITIMTALDLLLA